MTDESVVCDYCGGTGQKGPRAMSYDCPDCRGRGQLTIAEKNVIATARTHVNQPEGASMAGFATDTTETTIVVTTPDNHIVMVFLTYDGVNPEPHVSAMFDTERVPAEVVTTVLIDGIDDEADEDADRIVGGIGIPDDEVLNDDNDNEEHA